MQATSPEESIEQLRREYQKLEQQTLELAERVRSQQDAKSSRRPVLVELVQNAFEAKQRLHRAELAASTRRLEKIQQSLANRDAAKAQIVQRRVDELLNPEVDWQQKDSVQTKEQPGLAATAEQQPLDKPASTPELPRSEPDREARNVSPVPLNSSLLDTSPAAMRELLRTNADRVNSVRRERISALKELEMLRKGSTDNPNHETKREFLQRRLPQLEEESKLFHRELEFAELQYRETEVHLSVMLEMHYSQLMSFENELEAKEMLVKSGNEPAFGLIAAKQKVQQAKLELQRIESLRRLYMAAGDLPELTEASTPQTTLSLCYMLSKLGAPSKRAGNCELESLGDWLWIHSTVQPGAAARMQLAAIPAHADSRLWLEFSVQHAPHELTGKADRNPPDYASLELHFSDAEIQAAVEGKSIRKQLVLDSNFQIVEQPIQPSESSPGESLPGESLPGESLPGESLPGESPTGASPTGQGQVIATIELVPDKP